ncbi:MAG: FixH family protein, partial [Bdellovibrionales bacterium]
MPQDTPRNFKGSHVFLIFAAFFGIIIAVNGVFIYTALGTHTGVVTERPYEKGLAYNDTLEQAKAQPRWQTAAAYDNGVLTWRLLDEGAKPLDGAAVSAKLIRPVQDGNDFEVTLQPQGQG